ncbi:tetratricopeptide repeat protein [Massilia glaciei]|uniref:Tetratricopeptide repeat protein n=1 Tax=Massilia glaciei TaxID=1524097 RepID=A0A2U2HHW0_9BURK|nr:hypothetical protein [Massilia glaciei]PWF45465.1 hypothetical protein C7C56_017470 [Massilia glaciei]
MIKLRLAQLGLAMAAIGFTATIGLSSAQAADVRREIGVPLQAAQALMKAGKNREALAEVNKAARAGNKTPNETYLIERVRAAAASGAGDNLAAADAFEYLINSGKLSAAESARFSEGLVGIYMRARDFPRANAAIQKSLRQNNDPKMRAYLIQNYYSMGNYGQATKDLKEQMNADAKAGRAPSEDSLQMLANLNLKSGDKAGYVNTIEKLATYYPKASYWTDLLNRVSSKPGFSNRLSVDVYRIKFVNNLIKKPSDFMEMAQLVLQAGAPAEAIKVMDRGYKEGVLGVGAEAARHQRLKDLAAKNIAETDKTLAATEAGLIKVKDHDGLAALGYGLVQAGKTERGLKMMNDAIASDALRRPDDAKLHLGQAYAAAGKKAQAIAAFKTVTGADGTKDLARFNIMALNRPMN